jgi:N6-adenosine-specific RNA methylase IME4
MHAMTRTEWIRLGLRLSGIERRDTWALADWYLAGKQEFGPGWCKQTVEGPHWKGIKYSSLKVYATVAKRFPSRLRRLNCDFCLHQQTAALSDQLALPLLRRAAQENWNENKMRIEVRRIRWFRPLVGGDIVDDLADLIAKDRKYRGILADPPWRWERAGGKKGASTSYYPVMSIEELCALPVAQVATDDAFMFLWCAAAGLEEYGLPLLRAWGFTFKTHAVWDKLSGGYGVGSYWRMEHEDLLLGVRPGSPTHFNDDTMSSMIRAKRSRNHSEKPPEFHTMIERAINGPYLELFGRQHVHGWDVFGNQLLPRRQPIDGPHKLAAD